MKYYFPVLKPLSSGYQPYLRIRAKYEVGGNGDQLKKSHRDVYGKLPIETINDNIRYSGV